MGRLPALIELEYPKAGNGRRLYPLATMLRIHFMQQWFALSNLAMEDSMSMRQFLPEPDARQPA